MIDDQTLLILSATSTSISIIALVACVLLTRKLWRIREAQQIVMGSGKSQDVAEMCSSLKRELDALTGRVSELQEDFNSQIEELREKQRKAIDSYAVVRYDAYGELAGQQSSSIALLDATKSGLMMSTIVHRDQARLYVKQIHDGKSDILLSPEEQEAIKSASPKKRSALLKR